MIIYTAAILFSLMETQLDKGTKRNHSSSTASKLALKNSQIKSPAENLKNMQRKTQKRNFRIISSICFYQDFK